MKKISFLLLLMAMSSILLANTGIPCIIPQPSKIIMKPGSFQLNNHTQLFIETKMNGIEDIINIFTDKLKAIFGSPFEFQALESDKKHKNAVSFELISGKQDTLGEEGYRLDIQQDFISIKAATSKGLFYGIQTLWQLFPTQTFASKPLTLKTINLPALSIIDKPRFPWRGMLLDCCRHFFPKETVKKYIDLMAFYKMNRLHWHLTEDQAWRIEIKQYPKLTEIGSIRKEANGTTYGGYYSQEDIKELIAYASIRGISILPEIEMPGHSVAAIAAYPFLSCTQDTLAIQAKWGVFKDIYCAGNDSVFQFLENVLDEVMTLFPFEYIHIGGDEAPRYRWEHCNKCANRIKALGLKDAGSLQPYFIDRINTHLKKAQKKLIGWDEILDDGKLNDVTVQSWRGMQGAINAAKSGNDAIVSPTSHAYFDYSVQSISLDRVYEFEPMPKELVGEEKKHLLGGECNVWTEHITSENLDNMVFPRLLAMVEVLWSPKEKKNLSNFKSRLNKHYEILNTLNVRYGFEAKPVTFKIQYIKDKGFKVNLVKGQAGVKLSYAFENESNDHFQPFVQAFYKNSSCNIKVKASYKNVADTCLYTRSLVLHKAVGKEIQLLNPYSPSYSAQGPQSLIDGQRGTLNFRDGLWQGFHKNNMEAVIDLKKTTKVQYISAGFLQSSPSWIFFPEWVEFLGSVDGITYISLSKQVNSLSQKDENTLVHDFECSFAPAHYRFIKVIAKNVGTCPDWHDGAGAEAWLFADEIIVK